MTKNKYHDSYHMKHEGVDVSDITGVGYCEECEVYFEQ